MEMEWFNKEKKGFFWKGLCHRGYIMHQLFLLLLIYIIYNYISTILHDMKWPYMVEATPAIVVN